MGNEPQILERSGDVRAGYRRSGAAVRKHRNRLRAAGHDRARSGKVLSGKLGADASALAGPSGTNAADFNDSNVDSLSYSQSKGLFAGASLGSASRASDNDANKDLPGKEGDATRISAVPPASKSLVNLLQDLSPSRM
ncbi:MAG: YSC84-related protein [Candidatus Korobacteraceae bacterium]